MRSLKFEVRSSEERGATALGFLCRTLGVALLILGLVLLGVGFRLGWELSDPAGGASEAEIGTPVVAGILWGGGAIVVAVVMFVLGKVADRNK